MKETTLTTNKMFKIKEKNMSALLLVMYVALIATFNWMDTKDNEKRN